MKVAGFDWDRGNRDKCRTHGVSIAEIEALFRSGPRVAPSVAHSDAEDRFVAIGRNERGRTMFVAFTFRIRDGRRYVRPISARYMHKKEIERYEEEGS